MEWIFQMEAEGDVDLMSATEGHMAMGPIKQWACLVLRDCAVVLWRSVKWLGKMPGIDRRTFWKLIKSQWKICHFVERLSRTSEHMSLNWTGPLTLSTLLLGTGLWWTQYSRFRMGRVAPCSLLFACRSVWQTHWCISHRSMLPEEASWTGLFGPSCRRQQTIKHLCYGIHFIIVHWSIACL